MPVGLRKRRSDLILHRSGDLLNDRRPKHEPPTSQPLFSDNEEGDEDNESQPTVTKTSFSTVTMDASTVPEVVKTKPSGAAVTFRSEKPTPSNISSILHMSNPSDGTDEVEDDLEMFSKEVQISNIDQIDHANLMRILHERFKKKAEKWERQAAFYSKCTFGLNFFILVMQIFQILFHQLSDIFLFTNQHTQAKETKTFLPRVGLYRRYMYPPPQVETVNIDSSYSSKQVIQCMLAALTALVAGLQLKLKLTEKAERYRRGAKMYGRLLRMSTYYLMLLESGGKIDNVVALWREAMRKEGKWIPLVKTFMTL